VHDLVDVFGPQVVLGLALPKLPVGVDDEYMVAPVRARFVHHQQTGGDTGAVEQVAWQADDRLQITPSDEVVARLALFAAPEKHAMGHHCHHAAVVPEHGHHVLNEHQIGLLALFRHHHREPDGKLEIPLDVVLAEGRIGQHPVEAFEFVDLFVQVLGVPYGVGLLNIGMGDAV
jgi:hypothetical protein